MNIGHLIDDSVVTQHDFAAIAVVNQSADVDAITTSLKNIAAAHFIIVLAITGECLALG